MTTRSSRHSQGSQPGLADQAKLSFASAESLETMSEAELPLGFNRMNRFRQSLPLSRSTSQTKLRSPGVLFLQFGDETRRVHITHEISSMDTLHALIVHMFPQKLTMGMLKSPNTAILIKDESRNVFYELEDVRDIQDRSIIKIYRKEPLYASFPASHITNGDLRLQNQETVKTMLRRTEAEISVRVTDTMRKHEDPLQRQRSLVEEERLRYLNEEELITQQLNDLEKSVEKIQKDLAHNHRLIPVQELEEKAVVLKQLGETLTDLKGEEVAGSGTGCISLLHVQLWGGLGGTGQRQVDEGVWTSPSTLSQSPKKVAPETDFSKGLDLEMPTSPPVSLHHLTAATETLGMPSSGHSPPQTQTHPSKSNNPSRAPEMVPAKTQTGPETPSKKSADKAVSVELMKAIPALEFAAKHKQGTGSGSAASTPEHKPSKPQHAPKSGGKGDPNGRRGSDELTVPRYRTEKPSKAESEELETQKPQVKLRRTVSEVVRPASTPPIIASAIKDDDDEDRIIAELEVFQRSSASPSLPKLRYDPLAAAVSPATRGPPVPPLQPKDGSRSVASPGKGGVEGAGVGGEVAEGLCKGQLSPRRSMTLRSKEICEGTYRRLDSLEETIRELEITISEISSHPSAEFVFPKELLGQGGSKDASRKTREGLGDLKHGSCDDGTALDLSQAKDDAPESPSPSKTKPPLLPKPQLPLDTPQVYFPFSLSLCPAPDSL
nr:PREDICTED: SRC kinase signaling inhibitor 1 [Opisthocomus hoazin]